MSVGKIIRPSLPLSNVAANSTASGNITPGRTIEGIIFKLGGTFTVDTHIYTLRIKANGKTVIEGTGAQLRALSLFRGDTPNTGYLHIDFSESKIGRDFLDEMAGAWDTSLGVANISIEVSIGAATSPTLLVYTVESAPQSLAGLPFAGLMHKVLRYPYSVAAGGSISIPLPFGQVNGAIIKRIHLAEGTAGRITGVVVKQDGVVIHDSLDADNDYFNVQYRKANVAGFYHVDFIPDGNLKNALDTRDARSLELLPTFSAADSGFVIVEYLDKLGNL